MPSIEISSTDFQRLQSIAEPLVDTSKSVVTKLIDFYEKNLSVSHPDISSGSASEASAFSADSLPPLAHAKLMAAQFNGLTPEKTNWDSLVRLALTQVIQTYKSAKELHRVSGANVVDGKKEIEGYKYLAPYSFSYQGVSAEDAAKIIVRCAKALGCSAAFEFEWRDKEAAYRPGELGAVRL